MQRRPLNRNPIRRADAVSYTHLDVYKRQGVDFSPATLAKLREQLQSVPSLAGKVEVIERRADDFGSLDCNSFDTVVMNSVIFYFPNLAYLSDVLEKAINVVKPGGHVYVGDVLSLHLLPCLLYTSRCV